MAEVVSWQQLGKKQKKPQYSDTFMKDGVLYLRPQIGKQYHLRPLGDIFSFKKYIIQHNGTWRFAICKDQDTCPIATKHNARPIQRFAVNVIDRADGKLKVLQSTGTTFTPLQDFYQQYKRTAGERHGAQFTMKPEGRGDKISKYNMTLIGPHSVTQDDIKMIKDRKGIYPISKIYKYTDPQKIEQIIFGDIRTEKTQEKIHKATQIAQQDRVSQSSNAALSDLY